MKGYFIFSIGPVQGFISSARKTQDLYNASFILSYISSVALRKVIELGGRPIFPVGEGTSVPNIIMAEVETEEPEGFASKLKNHVEEKWVEIYTRAFMKFRISIEKEVLSHLDEFPEVYWVFTENEEDTSRFLSFVKNAKFFHQVMEEGEKCVLCGERKILFYRKGREGTLPVNIDAKLVLNYDELTPIGYKQLAPEEGLCALCMAKRLVGEVVQEMDKNFPSTAEVALMKVILENRDIFKAYRDIFSGYNFDYQLCYKENLTENYFLKNGLPITVLDRAKNAHSKLLQALEAKKVKLDKYYALLMMDGDDMGALLSRGDKQKISSALLEFSGFVEGKLVPPVGRRIYAGGDDILAFLNLHYAFDAIREIRRNYPDFGLGGTASASLVIAHYKTPLSMLLEILRHQLHRAKTLEGKDALSITLVRHSGEITTSYLKWEGLSEFIEILEYLLDGSVSPNFIVSLKSAFLKIKKEIDKEMFEVLARTFISRAISEEVKDKKKLRNEIVKVINSLYEKMISIKMEDTSSLWNFFFLLEIALFLKREIREGV